MKSAGDIWSWMIHDKGWDLERRRPFSCFRPFLQVSCLLAGHLVHIGHCHVYLPLRGGAQPLRLDELTLCIIGLGAQEGHCILRLFQPQAKTARDPDY